MKEYDVCVVGAFGVDTNVYLNHTPANAKEETQFVENLDNVGLSGGYCAQLFAAMGKRVRCIGFCGEDFAGPKKRRLASRDRYRGILHRRARNQTQRQPMCIDGSRKSFYDGKGSM